VLADRHGRRALARGQGAARHVRSLARLIERERRFLVLTNNSTLTPATSLAALDRAGLPVPERAI